MQKIENEIKNEVKGAEIANNEIKIKNEKGNEMEKLNAKELLLVDILGAEVQAAVFEKVEKKDGAVLGEKGTLTILTEVKSGVKPIDIKIRNAESQEQLDVFDFENVNIRNVYVKTEKVDGYNKKYYSVDFEDIEITQNDKYEYIETENTFVIKEVKTGSIATTTYKGKSKSVLVVKTFDVYGKPAKMEINVIGDVNEMNKYKKQSFKELTCYKDGMKVCINIKDLLAQGK